MQYSIADSTLLPVESQRDLGVIINSSLKFHEHIDKVCKKSMSVVSLILKKLTTRNADIIVNVYKSYAIPHLEYASEVWNPANSVGDICKLEGIQRYFSRSLLATSEMSYGARLERLGLFTLEFRRLVKDLMLVYKISHGQSVIDPFEVFDFVDTGARRATRSIFGP